MRVSVLGTTQLDRVDVIKDNRIVHTQSPKEPSPRLTFDYRDVNVKPGTHYYYARVIQADRNMAWISPIWVTVPQVAGR